MATKSSSNLNFGSKHPDFFRIKLDSEGYKDNLHRALMYLHAEMSPADLKKETIKYLKSVDNKHPLLQVINDINDNRITTFGKYMCLLNHKADIPEDVKSKLIPELQKVVEIEQKKSNKSAVVQKVETESTITISIQDRLLDKSRMVAGEVEGWLDDFIENRSSSVKSIEEFINLFKANELKSPHIRYMRVIFDKRASESGKLVSGEDKTALEGYSNFTKADLKKIDQFYRNLLSACDMLQEVAKVTRAPRKKKPVSHEKIISKLKFKKDDSTLGIASINPIQMLSSKEIWVYNTKTRKLAQYKAFDERGLSIKGTSIVNFSNDSCEKTLRKPAETLSEFKKASKVKLRTFLKELSTIDVVPNGKINEHHIILRVDK